MMSKSERSDFDGAAASGGRRSLSSKFRYAFLPLSEEWIFPRNARREGSAQPSQNALMLRDDRFAISSA